MLIAVLLAAPSLSAQARVDRNVVYGMYSGLALLMDVHHPAQPNGYGLILIRGSGWHSSTEYGAGQLKGIGVPQIVLDAGYTVFTINHRAAPRFRYPAAVEDVQRAVRFVRHHAERYGVDPGRLGGLGGSSGAHLVSMLGTMDGDGDPHDPDPVNRASAKLQAVVAQAAPTHFAEFDAPGGLPTVASFLGSPYRDNLTYREASPITYVTPDDPPLLLIHGDADQVVPFAQSQVMLAALEAKGVEARLIQIPGGGHGANDLPETARWLNRHLLSEAQAYEVEPLIAAYAGLLEGERLARAGNISEAVAAYRTAQERDARLTVTASNWNQLCWNGGLWGHAAEVMAACEQAVALASDHGGIRDSRGLARALSGNVAGAIDDFEAFVAWTQDDRARAQRQDWIVALRAGENPFTPEVLERLRN
jgi:acetyl esterase/lipase